MNYLKKIDPAKIYMIMVQVIFMVVGYITSVILSKVILSDSNFSDFQLVNVLTNIFNILAATSIPTAMAALIAKNRNESITILIKGFQKLLQLAFIFVFIIIVLSLIAHTFEIIDFEIFGIIAGSGVQVITYGILNVLNMYLIGRREIRTLFYMQSFYIALKSFLVLISAEIYNDVLVILGFIILGELIQSVILLIVLKINPLKVKSNSEIKFNPKHWDITLTNIALFGIFNLSVVLSYLGINNTHDEFNIYTLVQPWSLISFYLISSIANVYLVDFAAKENIRKELTTVLKNIAGLAIFLSLISLIGGSIFFQIFYPENFEVSTKLLLMTLPYGILISLISIIIYVYQGRDSANKLRYAVLPIIVLYIFVSFFNLNIYFIVGITSVVYTLIFSVMIAIIRLEK